MSWWIETATKDTAAGDGRRWLPEAGRDWLDKKGKKMEENK